ncbi:glutactin-like [Sabethes cyaneus]|uniref:glutactin-like n=1 Tax=Sabethes cyaneus TaxID=53552 RepID=UPI00237DA9C7|nr:glutactin-like [Sabethes cyaneus]
MNLLFLTNVLLSCLILVAAQDGQQPIVTIPELGTVRGSTSYSAWTNRTIYEFQAIPFAKSPTGDLRFQPPVKATSWEGTLDASKPGVMCPQIWEGNVIAVDEDCLTLSVFSNSLTASRPVMVFIHGGVFYVGSAMTYRPDYLLEADVVLVVIQYRLGPLGFLSTLSDKIPGNAGILDMIAALEWVQKNIEAFGGNSSAVTIFGESAGGAAVSALVHTPLTRERSVPLFRRAIIQSGSVFSPWAICDTPVESAHDIAGRLGCVNDLEQCLLQAPIDGLLRAFESHRTDMVINQGLPNVAGATMVVGGPSGLFPEHPKHYTSQVYPEITVMGGVTSQDGLISLNEIGELHPESLKSLNSSHDLLSFIRLIHETFGQTKLDGALEGYAIAEHFLTSEIDQVQWKDVVLGLTDICGNHAFKGPVLADLQALSSVNSDRVYLYSFDYAVDNSTNLALTIEFPYEGSVHHAADVHYLFPWSTLNERGVRIAKTMVQLWTSFARTGVPMAEEVSTWSTFKNLYGPYLSINEVMEEKKNFYNEFSATTLRFRTSSASSNGSKLLVVIVSVLMFIFRTVN